MSEIKDVSEAQQSDSAQDQPRHGSPHNFEAKPMVYTIPQDYATSARKERDRRIAEGADPDSVVLMSELFRRFPRGEGESPDDFARRLAANMKSMINRGVAILNDQLTAARLPSEFLTSDGRAFDLGAASGVTREEYQDFCHWFDQTPTVHGHKTEVPEKWLKFEKTAETVA